MSKMRERFPWIADLTDEHRDVFGADQVVGIEIIKGDKAKGYGKRLDGRVSWEQEYARNGDPRDGEAWQRFEQRLRENGL